MASEVAPIHSHSLKHWQKIKAQLKNINDLRDNRKVLEKEESFDKNQYDEQLIQLTAKYNDLNKDFKQHRLDSGYGHITSKSSLASAHLPQTPARSC